MSELKSCPFCGGEAQVQHQSRELYGDVVDWYGVYCKKQFCGYVSGLSTEAEAIATWNTRANDAAIGGEECEMEPSFTKPSRLDFMQEYLCSECGEYAYLQIATDDDKLNFCPNCGKAVKR